MGSDIWNDTAATVWSGWGKSDSGEAGQGTAAVSLLEQDLWSAP